MKKSESFLGVDIGSSGIKLLELRKSKGRPQLWTYALVDQPLDINMRENESGGAPEEAMTEDKDKKTKLVVP